MRPNAVVCPLLGTLAGASLTIVGSVGGARGPRDYNDNFRFDLALGTQLVSITLDSFDQRGPIPVNVLLFRTSGGDVLGRGTLRGGDVGSDLLDIFGFDALDPGDYTFRLEREFVTLGRPGSSYQLTFNVASDEVPEPGSLSLLLLGAGALFAVGRKRRST